MDFVDFESFSENDALPSPQPTLSIPLKSNIENLSLKLTNFNNLRNLLKNNPTQEVAEDDSNKLAEKYASLSLQLLGESHELPKNEVVLAEPSVAKTKTLSIRLARALNPDLSDSSIRELFGRFESKRTDIGAMIDPGVVGSMARKNLRGEIESDLIKGHAAVLADYAKPIKQLKYLGEHVTNLDSLVSETNVLLAKNHDSASNLTAEVTSLTEKKKAITLKKNLLASFRQKFVLNEYEHFVLSSSDINADFFAALSRAEHINDACRILLALDNPELGRNVMAKNSVVISRAVDKILTFCSRSLSNMYLLNNSDRLSALHMSLEYLQTKPDQLNAVTDTFVESRSAALVEEFNQQTSAQNSDTVLSSSSRPVFYSSHDPVRFIADLLAYVHSLVVNESETIGGLFDDEKGFTATVDSIVERVLLSLAKPIRAHIDQLISKETKLPILNQMFMHLLLYKMMFKKLKHSTKICSTIQETTKLAQDRIITVVNNKLMSVSTSNLAQIDLSADLQPPEWIIDFYADLLPVLDALTSDTVFELSQEEHEKFLALVVDEPINIFFHHLEPMSNTLNSRDMLIFKLNFLDLVLTKIMPLSLLSDKVLDLNQTIKKFSLELKEMQLHALLQDCGLTDFYNVMNMICPMDDELFEPSIYQAITENQLFTKETLTETNATIQVILPSALIDVQLALMKVNSPMIVNNVITTSSTEFAKFYKLFSAVVDMFLEPGLLSWTDQDVATLLGIDLAYAL